MDISLHYLDRVEPITESISQLIFIIKSHYNTNKSITLSAYCFSLFADYLLDVLG